jgi:hypothetical protein
MSGDQTSDRVGGSSCDLDLVQGPPSRGQEGFARIGQGHTAGQPMEKHDSELAFQPEQRV